MLATSKQSVYSTITQTSVNYNWYIFNKYNIIPVSTLNISMYNRYSISTYYVSLYGTIWRLYKIKSNYYIISTSLIQNLSINIISKYIVNNANIAPNKNISSIYYVSLYGTIWRLYKIKSNYYIINKPKPSTTITIISGYNIYNPFIIPSLLHIYLIVPPIVAVNQIFTTLVYHTDIPTVYLTFNGITYTTTGNQVLMTAPSTPGLYLVTQVNNIENPTVFAFAYINVIVPKVQPVSIYTNSTQQQIVKILDDIQIQQYTSTRESQSISSFNPLYQNNEYNNIYNKIQLNNQTLELQRPTQYNEKFYAKYKKIAFPIVSGVQNSNTNQMFYNSYPYTGLLNLNYQTIPLNLTNNNTYTFIKDIYINEQINTQYIYIPPQNITGVIGYSVFINGHFVFNSNTNLINISNTIPIVDYLQQSFYQPINIHNLFSPGRNRIVIILYYNTSINYIYNDNNMSFQFDLLINNIPYIWSGLYNEFINDIKQQNMTYSNIMIQQHFDNTIYINR